MPLLIKIVELDFSWPSFTPDYTGWRSDFTVAGTANEFNIASTLTYSTRDDNRKQKKSVNKKNPNKIVGVLKFKSKSL